MFDTKMVTFIHTLAIYILHGVYTYVYKISKSWMNVVRTHIYKNLQKYIYIPSGNLT